MSLANPLQLNTVRRPFDLVLDDLPGSKSLTNRALVLAAMSQGQSPSTLSNVLFADDTRVMLAGLSALGLRLEVDEPSRKVVVHPQEGPWGVPAESADLSLGNAGTAVRFLTAVCCLGRGPYRIDGVARMRERPIGTLVEALRVLGAKIECEGEEGYPPLVVQEGMSRKDAVRTIAMSADVSSQFISAVMQVAPRVGGLVIEFSQPPLSQPYIQMTMDLMRHFGAEVHADASFGSVSVSPGKYASVDYAVETDASNASYFLAAAALMPKARLRLSGLGRTSWQGDVHFASRCLRAMGAEVKVGDTSIDVVGPEHLVGIDVDLNDMPDMAQTLAVVALFAEGPTVIRNVGNLRVKETDRMAALEAELARLGAAVRVQGDDLCIEHPTPGRLQPADIETYDDHRMAMAFGLAAMLDPGVRIKDPDCVNKTFPEYWEYLDRLRVG